jgi:putative peptide zinc metalloprotease protein
MTQQLAPATRSVVTPEAPESDVDETLLRWRRSPGLELMGRAQDSGLKDDTYMIRRSDGQIIQISGLLHLVLQEIEPDRTADQIAEAVSAEYAKTLDAEGLRYVITKYLLGLGVVEIVGAEKSTTPLPRARTIMSLTMRLTLIPVRLVGLLSRLLAPLFHPVIVSVALAAWIGLGVLLLLRGDIWKSFEEILQTPVLVLAMMVVLAACAIVHELGHATATTYGGAKPGRIGVGVYIVFFAYFTDVSDSYRLNRAGRIRVDLGGLYFNVLTTIGLAIGYLVTGSGFLLMIILVLQMQMSQQLLPTGRFDGYYLIGDISGVPDLFSRAKPALLSLIPGSDKSGVADLKPWVRAVVVIWAAVVMPLLGFLLGLLIWSLPTIFAQTWAAGLVQADRLTEAVARGDAVVTVISVVSIIALALPVIGIVVILWRIAASLTRWAWRSLQAKVSPPSPAPRAAKPPVASRSRRTAEEFTDQQMLPSQSSNARQPSLSALARLRRGEPNHRTPEEIGAAEELLARLRTPIDETRRVVVMSRKGGVGKTTVTMALGNTYAATRGDRVIAVDANPDAGNLAHRIAPPGRYTITDILREFDSINSYARLRSFTTQSPESQLEVLAADDDPRIANALGHEEYDKLIDLLDRYYNLILLDTGTGILDSAHQGLLTAADQLVLVFRAGLDSGRAAALTLDWLEAHGYERLVSSALVVANGVSTEVGAPLDPMVEHFAHRCAKVITIPWDPELEVGGCTQLSALQPETLDAFEELAASVAELFTQTARIDPRPALTQATDPAHPGTSQQEAVPPEASPREAEVPPDFADHPGAANDRHDWSSSADPKSRFALEEAPSRRSAERTPQSATRH